MSQITIETEKTDYTGGDVVNGRCSVTIEQALPARGIRIRYHGYEHSYWTTGSGKNRHTHSETRTFFDEEQILFGQPKLSMTEVLADALKGIFSKDQYETRPDLQICDRTLFGAAPAKGQQMDDHYFGTIKGKILNFMEDFDKELYRRGIPAKTRHNEVSPNQFEIAPLYEISNLGVDHNLQLMDIIKRPLPR